MTPEEKKAHSDKLGKEFADSIRRAIGSDKDHGWGVEDSCEVIESIIAEDGPGGYSPSDEAMALIKMVVNPSAFRQRLEAQKMLNESKKNETRKASLKGLLEKFG